MSSAAFLSIGLDQFEADRIAWLQRLIKLPRSDDIAVQSNTVADASGDWNTAHGEYCAVRGDLNNASRCQRLIDVQSRLIIDGIGIGNSRMQASAIDGNGNIALLNRRARDGNRNRYRQR